MTELLARYARLNELNRSGTSQDRRSLLRLITETLNELCPHGRDVAELDQLLAQIAADYSAKVRADLASLVARNDGLFSCSAQLFARDEISVARPVLTHARLLSDSFLVDVIAESSKEHQLAVTQRLTISERVSQALVEHGDDHVVGALLANGGARISEETFDTVAERAKVNSNLQAPLVARRDIPLEILNALYLSVEKSVRAAIAERLGGLEPAAVDEAFRKNRRSLTKMYASVPDDMDAACNRVDALEKQHGLGPAQLVSLLREGAPSRTAFEVALARILDVSFDLVARISEDGDVDALALLCRGAGAQRSLFVTIAISLDKSDGHLGRADVYGLLYESVPQEAAQRAVRFWRACRAA